MVSCPKITQAYPILSQGHNTVFYTPAPVLTRVVWSNGSLLKLICILAEIMKYKYEGVLCWDVLLPCFQSSRFVSSHCPLLVRHFHVLIYFYFLFFFFFSICNLFFSVQKTRIHNDIKVVLEFIDVCSPFIVVMSCNNKNIALEQFLEFKYTQINSLFHNMAVQNNTEKLISWRKQCKAISPTRG